MKKEMRLESDTQSLHEIIGLMDESIISSIIAGHHQFKISKDTIMHMHKRIKGVVATMWSLIPMACEVAVGDATTEDKAFFAKLKNQLKTEIESFEALIVEFSSIKKES